jgi:hypothetical protein
MRGISRRLTGMVAAVVAVILLAPASALAISVSGTAAPTNLKAGSHSDFKVHISLGGSVKDLIIGLPPGEVGDPNAAPFCSVSQLNADSCPANTKVGAASTIVNLLGLLPNPLPVTGNIYNLAPHTGEPARFGIALHALALPGGLNNLILPPVILQSGVQVRQTDFGLDTVVKDIPSSATLLALGGVNVPVPIAINTMDLSLFGVAPGTGKPFLRNPTSCHLLHATFTAVSGTGATAVAASNPGFTPTGCDKLPFSPTFGARLGARGQNKPLKHPPVSTVIKQDAGEAGLRNATVFLPPDLGVNLVKLNQICPLATFNAAACPPNTVVGSATATSPLLTQPLTGPVVLVESAVLPDIGLNLSGPLSLNLHGALDISGSVTFKGLPDIPISTFRLTFAGGPDGLNVANRDLCAPPRPLFHVNFASYSGAKTSVDTRAQVDGCGATLGKCKKGKKHKKHRSANEAKKHKKHSCKKKKHKKKR